MIQSTPVREYLSRKGSYLVLRHRNILKEAIESAQNPKKENFIIHDMLSKQRQRINETLKELRPEQKNQPKAETLPLKDRKENQQASK